jgi:predicted nucleic acid-binding Zn finger protein
MDETLAAILDREARLSLTAREIILQYCEERGRKALRAIDEKRVKKYRDFFVVTGSTDEHIVEDDFCTCRDFIFRGNRCWHMLAVEIAERTGTFQIVDDWYLEQRQPPLRP